jgi:hypothetical protein
MHVKNLIMGLDLSTVALNDWLTGLVTPPGRKPELPQARCCAQHSLRRAQPARSLLYLQAVSPARPLGWCVLAIPAQKHCRLLHVPPCDTVPLTPVAREWYVVVLPAACS